MNGHAGSGAEPQDVLMPLHYFPSLEYFCCLMRFENIWLEAWEHYTRQTCRNRCYVLTANKVDVLSVPVLKTAHKTLIRDIRIDYGQHWIRRHWGCLTSAYANSPFFEYYAPDFRAVFDRKPAFLFDLNFGLLTLCLDFLCIKKEIKCNLSYQKNLNFRLFDARSCITDKKDVNTYLFYKRIPYYQTFGNDFIANLSILDLLFNTGPEATEVLKKSRREGLNDPPQIFVK